jgi:hypothetical protein
MWIRAACSRVAFLALIFVAVNLVAAHSVTAQLRGAWKLVEATQVGRDTTIENKSPQPGLVLFTGRHYSFMFVEGSAQRVPFADPARPTDAEKLRAFDTFAGHSGSYSVQDSTLEMTVVVAKSPSMMGTELRTSFARFTYRIVGDTLWLTRRSPAGIVRMKLVRSE